MSIRPDVQKWDLDQWQKMFERIYKQKNTRYSPPDICYRLLEEVGELVYPIKQVHLNNIGWQLPDVFAWLCALVSKMDEHARVSNIIWTKFHKGCPGCKKIEDCSCVDIFEAIEKQIEIPKEKKSKTLFELHKPNTVDDWQIFLTKIYGRRNVALDPMILLARLIEDIGDIARMIRKKESFINMHSKIASAFAWLFGICNRFSFSYEDYMSFSLSEITWNKYSDMCAKCHSRPCECPAPISRIFISFSKELEDEEKYLKGKIETDLNLDVISFPCFEDIWVPKGIMNQAFYLINTCDAAIILVGSEFSPKVYAEFLECDYRLDRNNIFFGIKVADKRDQQTTEFIKEIKTQHIYDTFQNEQELTDCMVTRIQKAIEKFKEVEEK